MTRIMFGCDKFCSYCVVPSARGPEQRRAPKEILDEIGLTMTFIIRYIDIKLRFECMKATIDIFQDENVAVLGVIKDINDKYKGLFDKNGELDDWHKGKEIREFDKIVNDLPEKYWVE